MENIYLGVHSVYDVAHSLPLGGVDRDFTFTKHEISYIYIVLTQEVSSGIPKNLITVSVLLNIDGHQIYLVVITGDPNSVVVVRIRNTMA